MDDFKKQNLTGIDIYDDKLVNKTGLGCGCDITKVIGMGNCLTQILDYQALEDNEGIESDFTGQSIAVIKTGEDYAKMTESVNSCLAENMKIGAGKLSFSLNLSSSLKFKTEQLDIYEYGMRMDLHKMYALNIKPSLTKHLKPFVGMLALSEIEAPKESNRTDKSKIETIIKKYGTHISTKAFYGCYYQYFMYREQNEWESSMEAQLKLGIKASIPLPDTDIAIEEDRTAEITTTDETCFKHSSKETVERRVGGDISITDLKDWFASCKPTDPNSCALLGYGLSPNDNGDSGLIPLYELLDENDERRTVMKEVIEKYIDEESLNLSTREMVVLDAYGKYFESNEQAPPFEYQTYGSAQKCYKYFRLENNIFDHVTGSKKGKFYFYYALGHLIDNAVVDIKFAEKGDIDADWTIRGDNSNKGIQGCLDNRYLAIKTQNIKNLKEGDDKRNFVTGFGVKVDSKIKATSKGTKIDFEWIKNPDSKNWYSAGLIHDDVACIYTKQKLQEF